MARKKRESSIPLEYREVVYYLGLDPDEIVECYKISSLPLKWSVKLKKGDLEWSGYIEAPPFHPAPARYRCEDLVNSTMDCLVCHGSGKVPKGSDRLYDLRTADAREINEALKKWRGWRLAFDTIEETNEE